MTDVVKERTLRSGKQITQHFIDGDLVEELHSHGDTDIRIKFEFRNGKKTREIYLYEEELVSRRKYDRVRAAFPDMPAPDSKVTDGSAEVLRMVARHERQKLRRSNLSDAQIYDSFCRRVMRRGRRAEAVKWIVDRHHTLGERNSLASKRLVDRLLSAGCSRIWACQIDEYDDDVLHENTGHLVMELPRRPKIVRKQVFELVDRLARETGYKGPSDIGQRFAYVKLD
jgi:hypothetical protein